MSFQQLLAAARVIPVITPLDEESTRRTSAALAAAGMTAVEITLRTPAALDSISAVKDALPALQVAAGTVTNARDLERALDAGADFCVSPGISEELLAVSSAREVDFLPGVATASEIMLGLSQGLHIFKLFPATAVGGPTLLESLAGPFPDARFCPTGGLTADNFRDYLALPNVLCCGGSWMVESSLVESGDWGRIESLAREAIGAGD